MTGYDNKRLDGRNKKETVQYCCTYIRVHRCSSTSTYRRKRYATRRAVRYIHTYIPYNLRQRNTELIKFIRAKRVHSTVLLYMYTSTPPQQYQYVPKETVRHQASCEEVYTYVYPESLAARYRGCVSISPVDTWQDGGTQVRTQLPLRPCWAITMHK